MSGQDDPLAELGAALRARAPRPDPGARASRLARAREGFERLHGAAPQPRRGVLAWVGRLGRPAEGGGQGRGGLVTATALLACGVLVLSPGARDMLRGPQAPVAGGATEPAAPDEATDPYVATAEPLVAGEASDVAAAEASEGGAPAAALRAVPPAPVLEAEAPVRMAPKDAAPPPEALRVAPGAQSEAAPPAAVGVGAARVAPTVEDGPEASVEGRTTPSPSAEAAPQAVAPPPAAVASEVEAPGVEAAQAQAPEVAATRARSAEAGTPRRQATPAEAPGVEAIRRALLAGALPPPGSVDVGALVAALAPPGPPVVLRAPWDPERLLVVAVGPAGTTLDWGPGVAEWRRLGEEGWRERAASPRDRVAGGGAAAWEARPAPGAAGSLGTLRAGGGAVALPGASPSPDARARWTAAVAGWAALLAGRDLEGWGQGELLALAQGATEGLPARDATVDLMRRAAALSR